jgi:hypothetical protein
MKRLHTGVIILDAIDIICIGFSAGSSVGWLVKCYRNRKQKRQDPLIAELKKKSPILMRSTKGRPLKLPLIRGGDELKGLQGLSLVIKNRKLASILMAIVTAKTKERQLKFLSDVCYIINNILTTVGFRFAVAGTFDYTHIILLGFPATLGGFLLAQLKSYPIFGVLIPLAILSGRGIEDIPDPYAKCRQLCEIAATYHNSQVRMQMENFNSLMEETAAALQLPLDKVPLICSEQPLSLVERYKLKELVANAQTKQRVQQFSEFIKRFPECNADPEAVYEETIKLAKRIKVNN